MQSNLNKPIANLSKLDISNIKVICFDVDGVTIKKGTEIEEKGTELRIKTNILEPRILEKIKKLKKYFHITINSGRSSMYLYKVYSDILWDNASLISEIGIFILYKGILHQSFQFSDYELATLKKIYEKLKPLAESNTLVRGFEPKQFLITLHCSAAITNVDKIITECDSQKEFYCWWNGEAYDICPKRFNKGAGLKKLTELLGVDIKQTLAIGNGINDKDMTDLAGIGVTTDISHLFSDYSVSGEHLGGELLIDHLLSLVQ